MISSFINSVFFQSVSFTDSVYSCYGFYSLFQIYLWEHFSCLKSHSDCTLACSAWSGTGSLLPALCSSLLPCRLLGFTCHLASAPWSPWSPEDRAVEGLYLVAVPQLSRASEFQWFHTIVFILFCFVHVRVGFCIF